MKCSFCAGIAAFRCVCGKYLCFKCSLDHIQEWGHGDKK